MFKKFLYYLPSIVFNLAEVVVSILVGFLLQAKIEDMILVIVIFNLLRNLSKTPAHYKSWILCFIWTVTFYVGLFYLSTLNFKVMIICTIFYAIVLTNKGDLIKSIKNSGMWGGNVLNKEVLDWVKYNQENEKICKYEKELYKNDKIKYYIFKYRFREFKSYDKIADLMDMDKQRVCDEIKVISHFIQYSIKLNEYE